MRDLRCLAVLALAVAALVPVPAAAAPRAADGCEAKDGFGVLVTPLSPGRNAPLKVMMAGEAAVEGELSLIAPDGSVAAASSARHGGPPYFWTAEVAQPAPGRWTARLVRTGAPDGCAKIEREITVASRVGSNGGAQEGKVWPLRAGWTRAYENLYAAWIETLFDAPLEETLSWPALSEVLRDGKRNALFNYLGLGEDARGMQLKPDCADLPYFLRGYFAFKMGLPYGYSKCTRGGKGGAPSCREWWTTEKEEVPPAADTSETEAGLFGLLAPPAKSQTNKNQAKAAALAKAGIPPKPKGFLPGVTYYLGTTVANGVHSGNGRTAADDNATDYYPVPLTADALRPGTIYADPYGHVLVLVRRLAQTKDAAGLFLAVDGQPDGTVARKRFWRGNFLYAVDPALGGPGFKRFRPIVREQGGLRRLSNAEITKSATYGDFSLAPSKLSVEEFYDRMEDVMSPSPLDPMRALTEAITALEEQVKTRVTSVENGRLFLAKGGAEVAIPEGPSIFETTGAWEDFATPSRDLRLLIAIDVVKGFPDRVARLPERYAQAGGGASGAGGTIRSDLQRRLDEELKQRTVAYTRTDGSSWTLSLADVVARAPALEVAYNVNDCVEVRWGASRESDEGKTCTREASEAQRRRMEVYREWFHERKRPPRG